MESYSFELVRRDYFVLLIPNTPLLNQKRLFGVNHTRHHYHSSLSVCLFFPPERILFLRNKFSKTVCHSVSQSASLSTSLWFRSYLADRSQHVTVHLSSSETTQLTCGVPQGSVLGPILFLMYTAQLGKVTEGYGVGRQLFADDNGLYDRFHPDQASADVAVQNMEDCCQEVKKWMSSNKLKLNDEKTEAILCGSKTQRGKVS